MSLSTGYSIFRPEDRLNKDFVRATVRDLSALNVSPPKCRDHYLNLLSRWMDSEERERVARNIPVHLLELKTDDLSDEDAEAMVEKHDEHIRNVYRELFGDRANPMRTCVRREVKDLYCVFITIFALVYPSTAREWDWSPPMHDRRHLRHRPLQRQHFAGARDENRNSNQPVGRNRG